MSAPDRNPYAPPTAPVVDAPPADERGPKPIHVFWAIGLLWGYLALDAVDAAWHLREPLGSAFRQLALAGVFVGILAAQGWVIYQISLGKPWARVLALAWWMLTLWLDVHPTGELSGPLPVLIGLENLLTAVALFLLFLTPGRQWFRRTSHDRDF